MVPVRNLYHLLCYAWGHAERGRIADVGALESDRVEDLLAHLLVSGVGALLRRGLDRAYMEDEGDIRGLRGKVDVSATTKRQLERTGRTACRFDELSYDALHNRLLRATMLRLALAATDRRLGRELVQLARRFPAVGDVEPTPALFRRVQLHRNNGHYRFLLDVCELACRSFVPEAGGAGYRFVDVRKSEQEMGALFEAFVRNFLRAEQDAFRVSGEVVPWAAAALTPGSSALLPTMRTDVSLVAPSQKVILETKFYASPLRLGRDGKRKLREEHLYQVLAYLRNLEEGEKRPADGAVLLYAAAGERFEHRYRVGRYELRVRTLDLAASWDEVWRELTDLAADLAVAVSAAPSAMSPTSGSPWMSM